jgi:hypothetical protein
VRRLPADVNAVTETGHPGLTSRWNMMMMMMIKNGTKRRMQAVPATESLKNN